MNNIKLRISQKEARVKKSGADFVYILQLKRGKYYVGFTTSPVRRCRQHFSGLGAAWTRKYSPLEILLVKPGNKDEELRLTLEMMHIYGGQNVRGSYYCATKNFKPPKGVRKHTYSAIRKKHPNAYKRWSWKTERLLLMLKASGSKTKHIAKLMGRQTSAICSRLRKIGAGGGI